MVNEVIVREHPVIVREHRDSENTGKKADKPDNVIDAKYRVIRESRFNRDKVKRIPHNVGRLAKEAGKAIWSYTIGHESNETKPSGASNLSSNRTDRHAFHPDDVVARRSSQISDGAGSFWTSNSFSSTKGFLLNQTVGNSFNWGLQTSGHQNKSSVRYVKRYKGGKSWKRRK